jgi:hypothetical protein
MGVCDGESGSGLDWVNGAGVWKALDGECLGVDREEDTNEALRTSL